MPFPFSYFHRKRPAKFDPFIFMSLGGATNFNAMEPVAGAGGGVNWWFHRRIGIRTAARVVSSVRYGEPLASVSVGLAFR